MLSPEAMYNARSLCGVCALVSIFSQLAFSPFVLDKEGICLAIKVYEALLSVAGCELSYSLRERTYITRMRQVQELLGRTRHSRRA